MDYNVSNKNINFGMALYKPSNVNFIVKGSDIVKHGTLSGNNLCWNFYAIIDYRAFDRFLK